MGSGKRSAHSCLHFCSLLICGAFFLVNYNEYGNIIHASATISSNLQRVWKTGFRGGGRAQVYTEPSKREHTVTLVFGGYMLIKQIERCIECTRHFRSMNKTVPQSLYIKIQHNTY